MFDFILGLGLAALIVRGWVRGLVREVLDLVGLVIGIWVAFRLSGPLGDFLIDRFGVAPEVATIGSGIVLFILFGVSMSIAAHFLTKVMNLPGLGLINRVGGAAVALTWGVALLLVILNIARVLPLPEAWSDGIEQSTVAQAIAGPDAFPQKVFESFASDDVLGSLAAIQGLFGQGRVVPEGDGVVEIPPARADEIRQVRDEAGELLEMLNEFRAGEGLRPLASSAGFTEVAEMRAAQMYQTGRISRETPPGRFLSDSLRDAGIRVAVNGENIALASSSQAAFDAMVDSPTGLAILSVGTFDRVGIAVVEGPTGRLVVFDFGG